MSNTRIEKGGIHIFETFIFQSRILRSEITKGDKYPSWDGEIIVYKAENHNDNFEKVFPVTTREGEEYIEFNSALKMEFNKDLVNFIINRLV